MRSHCLDRHLAGAIVEGCHWAPVSVVPVRRQSGLPELPPAGVEAERALWAIEELLSPLVRVVARLAQADPTPLDALDTYNKVRRPRIPPNGSSVQRLVVQAAHHCVGLPVPYWRWIRGVAQRADACDLGRMTPAEAWRQAYNKPTGPCQPHGPRDPLSDELPTVSGWDRHLGDLDPNETESSPSTAPRTRS